MVSELAKSLSGQALNNELYVGANVQEVGLRGAHTSTTKFDPEIFLAVDCSPAADVFGDQGAIGKEHCFASTIQVTSCYQIWKTSCSQLLRKRALNSNTIVPKVVPMQVQHTWRTAESHQPTIGVCARYIPLTQTLYAMDDFLQAQASYKHWLRNWIALQLIWSNTIEQHRSRSPVRGF